MTQRKRILDIIALILALYLVGKNLYDQDTNTAMAWGCAALWVLIAMGRVSK